MSKKWKCAIITDETGDIMIGTNGDTLRIRRAGIVPIEVELRDCQTTQRENLKRADFDFDPMVKSMKEIEKYMDEQREHMAEQAERSKKFSLKRGIQAAMHGLAENGKKTR